MPHGKLDVYVEGALQIKDTSILGKGSPHCTLTTGNQEFRSPPVPEGGTLPYFNKYFEFQIDRSTEQLEVKIFSRKTLTDDELLGYCIILFKEVFYHGHVVPMTPYALTRPSGRPGGHIRLSLNFTSQPRRMAPSGGYLPPQQGERYLPPQRGECYLQPQPGGGYLPPQPGGGYLPPQPSGGYLPPQPGVDYLAPQPGVGYLPPQPSVGPDLQPRPVGSGQGAPSYRQPCPPPQQQQHPAQNLAPGPSAYPSPYDLPRRVNEHSSSSSNSESESDDDNRKGPGSYIPAAREYDHRQPPASGCRPGPPPRPQPQPPRPNQPISRGAAPPPPNNNPFRNFGGALLQNLGGALVGSAVGALLNPDGDGSGDGSDRNQWNDGGDDESYGHDGHDESYGHDGHDESYGQNGHDEPYGHDGHDESYGDGELYGHGESYGCDESHGHDEMTSFESAPCDERDNEDNASVVQFEFAEAYEADEREVNGNGAGAPGYVGGSAGPPAAPVVAVRGRGRAGPPGLGRARQMGRAGRAARPAGRAGVSGRGGRGPPMARGAPLHMARGGPPVMRGRAAHV